jgi:hypothetical protein
MHASMALKMAGALAVGLLGGASLGQQSSAPPAATAVCPVPPLPRSPFEEALRQAYVHRYSAVREAVAERERVEAAAPQVAEGVDDERWQRGLMALDRRGELCRARWYAGWAAELARTHSERSRVAMVRVRLECDSGNHQAELAEARSLFHREPGDRTALLVLLKAAGCCGRISLQRWAARELERAG